jgi:hypothetical protein
LTSAYCNAAKLCVPRATIGIACKENRECDSNVCADGNCCERTCDQLCEACNQKGTEGKCAPKIGAPAAGHGACPPGDAAKPCEAPSCDGTVRDKCLGRPGADTVCQDKSCTDGTEKPEARCDGKGTCAAATPRACKPYSCALDACKDKCTSNADCQAPATCDTASGTCINSGKCEDDGYTAVSADGAIRRDCRPFRCDPSGTCKETCTTSTDCIAPNVCESASSKCVAPPSEESGSEGGCSTTTARAGLSSYLFLLVACAFMARRAGARDRAAR